MLYRKTLKLKMKKINYEHCVINMVSVMKIIGAIIKKFWFDQPTVRPMCFFSLI